MEGDYFHLIRRDFAHGLSLGYNAKFGISKRGLPMVAEYKKRWDILCEVINAISIFRSLAPPLGAFYLFPEIDAEAYRAFLANLGRVPGSGFNAGENLQNFLLEHNIGSIAGNFFGAQGEFHRFAYACSTDQVVEAAKLREIFGVS